MKHGGHRYNLSKDMPTCSVNTSSVPFHSNHCTSERLYNAFYRFNEGQFYDGEFFRDGLHGEGTYKWNDTAVYEGSFYSNYKEGYASVSLPDNSYFEGLFIRNSPFGPGILTYANGRQDAGFWLGRKLVRLSRAVDFIIPRLAPTSAAKIKLLQFRRLIPLSEENCDLTTDIMKKCGYPCQHFYSPYSDLIYDPRSIFFDKQAFDKLYFVNNKEFSKEFMGDQKNWENTIGQNGELEQEEEEENLDSFKESSVPTHCLCRQSVFAMELKDQEEVDICERESVEGEYEMGILTYFTKFGAIERPDTQMNEDSPDLVLDNGPVSKETLGEIVENKSQPPNIVSWNRSELCTEMLKQIFRYRTFEEKLNFNLAKLMLGARTDFRRTGLKEKQSVQFLKMCSIGPAHIVKDLLCSFEISEELMDARGNNSLMFAAATDQHDIIDILLDYGVDVNTFNDENLTPLNLCLLRRLAQANGISSWETAFLPKEIDTTDIPQTGTEWQNQESIPSLDRIFGDGMSINDSKSRIFDSQVLTPFPSPTFCKELEETNQIQQNRYSADIENLSTLSQITILNISKSPGSHSLIHINQDDDMTLSRMGLKRTASASEVSEAKAQQPLGSNEETPKVNVKLIPKSNKRDEFVRSMKSSSTDKYLFAIRFENNLSTVKREDSAKSTRVKNKKEVLEEEQHEEETMLMEGAQISEVSEKIAEIDKTIQKLLKRGADPNISEVPRPSIHLGIYTKDFNTVYSLLLCGANPNSQLYPNELTSLSPQEGLLTPLHVIVLQKSAPEYVGICDLLLNFGADVMQETFPEFSISEEESTFLDPERGRTPLQLLCMRPDLEYADPEDNLIKIGLRLAKEQYMRKCFYNGHSCLTLAMLTGNIKLLQALLESRLFDPNEILEKDRGTALHVLVSTELQRKTHYDNSIKMCDLLIAAGANPFKKFRHPKSLRGTCVNYGYREIEIEREARKAPIKKDVKKPDKSGKERDQLLEHVMVVEYLYKIASDMSGKRKSSKRGTKGKKRGRGDDSQDSFNNLEKEEVGKGGKYDSKKKRGEELKNDRDNLQDGMNDSDTELNKKKKLGAGEDKDLGKLGKKKAEQGKGSGKAGKGRDDKKMGKSEELTGTGKEGGKTQMKNDRSIREKECGLKKLGTGSMKTLSTRQFGTCTETFPEKLRKELLKMYGNCVNIDINEFLVPYVVLRDGELYYRFQGSTSAHKEQYSLI